MRFRKLNYDSPSVKESLVEKVAIPEIVDCFLKTFTELDLGSPIEFGLGKADIGATLERIVLRQWARLDLRARPCKFDHHFCKVADREFVRVSQIDGTGKSFRTVHETQETLHKIAHEAEAARLGSIAVDGDRLALQGLHDEVGDDASIGRMHPWSIGIEDADNLDVEPKLAMIIKEQCFCAAFTLIIAGADADRIDVAPIGFDLWMNRRITIDLTSRGLEDPALQPFRQTQHVDRAVNRRLCRLHRIMLVVDRRSRAGEIEDLVNFDEERKAHVVAKEFEPRVLMQMLDVPLGARKEIVDAQDIMPLFEQPVDQVRPEEPGSAGYQNTFLGKIIPSHAMNLHHS